MSQIILVIAIVCVSCLVTTAPTATEMANGSSDIEKVILQLESEGRLATLKNDIQANDRLLAENWLNVNPDGSMVFIPGGVIWRRQNGTSKSLSFCLRRWAAHS